MEMVNHKSSNKYKQKQHMNIDLVTHKVEKINAKNPLLRFVNTSAIPSLFANHWNPLEILNYIIHWRSDPVVSKLEAKHSHNGVVTTILTDHHHDLECKRNVSIIRITMMSSRAEWTMRSKFGVREVGVQHAEGTVLRSEKLISVK